MIARRAALLVTIALLLSATAHAQALRRLTVTNFALSADTAKPLVGTPFHVFVTLHVRERVPSIDELELPSLASLEVLGDERRLSADASGTAYRETIALVAHAPGTIHIGPATLDAIDARDGKPKRYSTNDLTLQAVAPNGAQVAAQSGPSALENLDASIARTLPGIALFVIPGITALILLGWLLARRPALPPAPPVPPPAAETTIPAPRNPLADARAAFLAAPARATAADVRLAARAQAGAVESDTLADLLGRTPARDGGLGEVLSAAERATFTYDADLASALDALRAALERYAG